MLRQRQKRGIVDDVTLVVLAGHRRLHPVVKDLDRHAVQRFEGLHVAAQQRLQILMQHIAGEDKAGVAQHHAEQPDDTRHTGLVGELYHEAREVDLALHARPGLEADLVRLGAMLGPDRREVTLHRRVGAHVAHLPDLAGQPRGGQVRKCRHPLAQELHVRSDLARPARRARTVDRNLDAPLDVFAHGLGIAPRSARDRGHRQSLPVQLQYHHGFSKSDHQRRLPRGDFLAPILALPMSRG